MGSTLVITAPAKVNLYLEVGAPRDDGYHNVTTVLHALDLSDTVTITANVPFTFACDPDLAVPAEENLAVRAARAMARSQHRDLDVAITLVKKIPAGGGLGGASADAAAVIVGLARLWAINPEDAILTDVARALGADVPFFLTGGAALLTGRGDVLERRLPALDAPVVLVKPPVSISTAAAYAAFDRLLAGGAAPMPGTADILTAFDASDAALVAHSLANNMVPAAVSLVPRVTDLLTMVSEHPGVRGATMAGSGSTVFGVCESDAIARHVATAARASGLWAAATRFSARGCTIRTA